MIICLDFCNTYNGKKSRIKSLVRCDDCGKERIINKNNALKSKGVKYCKSCRQKGDRHPMYGKKHNRESIKKMSLALKGKKNPFYGKHHSEETKQKLSLSHKGEKSYLFGKCGKEHPKFDYCPSNETLTKMSLSHFGKHHSDESRLKIGLSKRGEKSFNWRHDLTQEERENSKNRSLNPELREWRKKCLRRMIIQMKSLKLQGESSPLTISIIGLIIQKTI